MFELLENLDGLADVDGAIRLARGRVAQLANTGVSGAGIVPTVRAFLRQFLGDFVDLNGKGRLQALEHRAQVGGHDAAADQDDIGVLNVGGIFHKSGVAERLLH